MAYGKHENSLDEEWRLHLLMPIELVCGGCGAIQYSSYDLKSPKEAIRVSEGKCKSCGKVLSVHEFTIEVRKSEMGSA